MPARAVSSRLLLVALALFLGTVLLYARSLGYGFINYDDPRYVLNNPHVQAGFTAETWRWVFTGHGDIWNPLVRLSHVVDGRLFGPAAAGHHLQSILWHALNAALAFLLLRRLTCTFWASAFAAALFAWHPLRVESVTWISERKDVVSVAFGLLTLLAYLAFAARRATRESGAWPRYALALLAFAAALLSKPSMVALPAVMLLFDFWPLRRFKWARAVAPVPAAPETLPPAAPPETEWAVLLEKAPFGVLAGVASYITIQTQTAAGDFVLTLPFGARLANAVVSLPRYLGKFFWPFDLAVAYPHPGWWPVAVIAAAAVFAAAVFVATWRTRRSHPWLAVGWLWFLVALLPMSGVVQVGFQSMADRYSYFPLLGWQLAAVWTAREWVQRHLPRGVITALAALLLLGAGVRTWDQQSRWRDSVTLYRHAVAVTDRNAPALAFLAYTYSQGPQRAEARAYAEQALRIEPSNTVALYTLATLDAAEGRAEEAIAGFRTLLQHRPDDADGAASLGQLLLERNRLDEAEALFRGLLARDPDATGATLGLGAVAIQRRDPDTAYRLLESALARQPAEVALLEQLAVLLHGWDRDAEAAALFARALAARPPTADLHHAHAVFLRATGAMGEALAAFDRALALEPRGARHRCERAEVLAALGRHDEALADFAEAQRLEPSLGIASYRAALLYQQRGDTARATDLLRQAAAAQPGLVPAQLALATIAEQAGRTTEADTAFAAALAAAPRDPLLHRTYAEVLAKRRQFDAALGHFRRCVELAPGDAVGRASYGYLLFLTGHRDQALAEWEEALRLQPDLPGLRERLARFRASGP